MSIRINSDTTKFVEVLGNKVSLNSGLYINVKQYIAGLANPSSIAWIPFVAKNTIRDWGNAQETPPSGEQVVSIVNSYFSAPMLYEFSDDGVSWHSSQSATDIYYRQRFDIGGTAWGGAVRLVDGRPGEDGKNAPLVLVQYSVDGATWNDSQENAEYIRFSTDDGKSWQVGFKVKGDTGAVFTPAVDAEGNISWTNNGELENPATVNIRGPQGKTGAVFTPAVDAEGNISWTNNGDLENPVTMNIRGPQGKRGEAFKIDATGLLEERSQYDSQPTNFWFLATDNGNVYVKQSDSSGDWSDPIPFRGEPGKDGVDGKNGYTPIRGTDYWTAADINEIRNYCENVIMNGAW
jgi:hypothetical protein